MNICTLINSDHYYITIGIWEMHRKDQCFGRIHLELGQGIQQAVGGILWKFGRIPRHRWKRPLQKALGLWNIIDRFSTRFSSITREWNTLQVWELSQKISFAILRRLVYDISGNNAYLKSEIGQNGRFWCILGFFTNFRRFWDWNLHTPVTRWRWSNYILFPNFLFVDFICIRMI